MRSLFFLNHVNTLQSGLGYSVQAFQVYYEHDFLPCMWKDEAFGQSPYLYTHQKLIRLPASPVLSPGQNRLVWKALTSA